MAESRKSGDTFAPQLTARKRSSDGSTGGGLRGKAQGQKDARQLEIEQVAQREALFANRNNAYVAAYLEKRTNFDTEQIKALQKIYKSFKGTGSSKKMTTMDRLCYRDMVANLFGITDNMMLDRIFQAFDRDHEGSVSEVEWIIGLSVQMRGSIDQQIAYAYDVYDVNSDRSLGREEISSFVRHSLFPIPGVLESDEIDDGANELIDLALRKFDLNHDGAIAFSEFRHVLRKEPYLMEVFGEVLPTDRTLLPTMALLDTNIRSFTRYFSRPGDSAFIKDREHYDTFQTSNTPTDDLTLPRYAERSYTDYVPSEVAPIWQDGTTSKKVGQGHHNNTAKSKKVVGASQKPPKR